MRLADLMAAAGGPLVSGSMIDPHENADLGGAFLLRDGHPLPIDMERAMQGEPRHNVRIRSGDHLFVPSSRGETITILGEVRSPLIVGFRDGVRLTQALAMAGGLAPDAHRSDIRVVRGQLEAPRVYKTSLRALVDGEGTDVELAPGDIVFVTRTRLASIRDVLNAINPLLGAAQNIGLGVGLSRANRP
jgi:polysaccharide export outer membrane protein